MNDARTTVINISLPERLLNLADKRAYAEARTRSDFFREAVRRYLGLTTVVAATTHSNAADVHTNSAGFDYDHNPTWRIFRVMAEFIDGFQFVAGLDKTVTIFGSARTESTDTHYLQAVRLGELLAKAGIGVVTGGGPGIMEAGNKGAAEAGGESIGLNIELQHTQRINQYVQKSIAFNHFFVRKVMMDISARAYVFFPGGFGTLDEFFELITLKQTGKAEKSIPVVLVGKDFWLPLMGWLKEYVLARKAIDPEDLDLWTVVDTAEEAFEIIHESKARIKRFDI